MLCRRITVIAVLFVLLGLTVLCFAEEPKERIRVGISPFSPFVILSESRPPSGYSIDLWQELTHNLGVDYEFVQLNNVAEKLQALSDGQTDVAIGGITVTGAREEFIDFCHPHFHTGLDILIPSGTGPSLKRLLSAFISKPSLSILAGFCVMLILAGHLIWIAERRSKSGDQSFSPHYLPGVLEGIYWAIVTASTVGYGDKVPKKWSGRILTGIIIVTSLPLFAFFVAELASVITVRQMRADIRGPEDLWGRRVGVVKGTTSEEYLAGIRADVSAFRSIRDAVQSLRDGRLDAVVYDQPNLLFYAEREGGGTVSVVGNTFAPQDYALAVTQKSPLRERLNLALLALAESGELTRIYTKWFGQPSEN